jgi:hypothetical protein
MKKSTTFFEAKFIDHTRFLKNSFFFEGAVAASSSGFGVVVKVVMEPVEFIAELGMKLLDCNSLRPGLIASLSQVAGYTAAQCRSCYSNYSNAVKIMKKSTTFFEAKFDDCTRFLKNSHSIEVAVAAYSSGFEVVVRGVAEHVEFIMDLEMNVLDCSTLRPGLVASLSQVAGRTAAQCH